jgi:hypothetical protein
MDTLIHNLYNILILPHCLIYYFFHLYARVVLLRIWINIRTSDNQRPAASAAAAGYCYGPRHNMLVQL